MTPHAGPMSKKLINTGAAAAAAAVLVIGGYLVGNSSSDSSASTANTGNASAQQGGPAFNGQPPGGGQSRPGFGPRGGMGNEVTGGAAQKVQKAVAAKFDGNIERILQLPDGSYLAHVITSNGEVYVKVSKSFDVTGSQQRPQGAMPQGTGPSGSQSGTGSTTS